MFLGIEEDRIIIHLTESAGPATVDVLAESAGPATVDVLARFYVTAEVILDIFVIVFR